MVLVLTRILRKTKEKQNWLSPSSERRRVAFRLYPGVHTIGTNTFSNNNYLKLFFFIWHRYIIEALSLSPHRQLNTHVRHDQPITSSQRRDFRNPALWLARFSHFHNIQTHTQITFNHSFNQFFPGLQFLKGLNSDLWHHAQLYTVCMHMCGLLRPRTKFACSS